ncbi:MAG: tRNA (adenosine(37)-N6)-threonylcarbamoyltransferase complex ATPase subunit type 1 TsaE, partial [Planctomycetes bacterium]|nr:tRNA (adenosine(37)-N6)-threonylcarbamoyltransferase complex ATPase subunit type 1 TsaE [Planctomycetota bacterium]
MRLVSRSPDDTRRAARILAGGLAGGEIISLVGELGAGKTVFVQGLADGLGIRERITSPTFVIHRFHEGRLTLDHIDAYRLAGAGDLDAIGAWEFLGAPGRVAAIEWGERVESVLERFWRIRIESNGPES